MLQITKESHSELTGTMIITRPIKLAWPNNDLLEIKKLSFISAQTYVNILNISFCSTPFDYSPNYTVQPSEFDERENCFF
jgi:hypothetical protein